MKSNFGFLALLVLSTNPEQVFGRKLWDPRVIKLHPRRFIQVQPPAIQKLRDACPSPVCDTLANQAVTPLLSEQPECSQQDMADSIIEASKQFDATTASTMVAAAVEYRQVEKNTPPDFTKKNPALRNSVFCQKAPKNHELNGLVQAQDPANDQDLFYDPATNATVPKGSQANTTPFGYATTSLPSLNKRATMGDGPAGASNKPRGTFDVIVAKNSSTTCPTVTTPNVIDTASGTPSELAGVDFGSCSVPEIEFGAGFDNRKETSFQPTDKRSYNHGSAQNIAIITQFMCDALTNTCKANQAAKDLCANATQAAAAGAAKTGIQADNFNAVFRITTDFAAVPVVNDQGQTISPGISATSTAATVSATSLGTTTAQKTSATTVVSSSSIGNFGSCSVPQIEFGAGFDGRKETSFQPSNKTSFTHGSAQNIDVITQSICDTLTNSCRADQTAKDTCAQGQEAASAAPQGTGIQADRFNLAFGIQTNFASVTPLDNQGNPVGATSQTSPATQSSTNTNSSTASTSGNLQMFHGALGGFSAPPVISIGNGEFQVVSQFNNQQNAIEWSCAVQNNICTDAANVSGNKSGFTVAACNAQQVQCNNTA